MTQNTNQPNQDRQDEYVTIIAPSLGAVMSQFRRRGLAQLGFAITGPAGRHQFAYAGNGKGEPEREMFGGAPMVAATFKRGR